MRLASVSLFASLTLATTTEAADPAPQKSFSTPVPPVTANDWTIDLGGGAIYAPKYPGAEHNKVLPIPYVALNYRDIVFASVRDGLGVNLINAYGFKAGPVLKVMLPRKESDDRRALRGLGDVDTTLEGGGFVEYTLAPYFSTKLELRKGIASFGGSRNRTVAALGIDRKSDGHEGVVGELSANFNLPPLFGDRLLLSAGPRASYFDKDYAQAYYGITPEQARASGYRAYTPKSGIGKVGAGALALYPITQNLSAVAFADYGRLVGDVAKSPIVRGRGGSRGEFTIGTALSYRFNL